MKNSKWDGKSPLVSISSETDNTNTSSTGAIQTDIASFANDSLTQSLVEGQIIQSKGVDSSCIDKVFAGGIEEYSPNEANRHTKVVLSIR